MSLPPPSHPLSLIIFYYRFCCDCKNKVLKAFNILIGEYDSNKEKGYCAHLFDNFKFIDKNIQIKNDKLYLTQLISRAEPEIQGRFVCLYSSLFVFIPPFFIKVIAKDTLKQLKSPKKRS